MKEICNYQHQIKYTYESDIHTNLHLRRSGSWWVFGSCGESSRLQQGNYSRRSHYLLLFWILLTLFRMGIFGAAHGWWGPKRPHLPKICDTYPTMMKLGTVILYLKKIWKIYESRDTPAEFCRQQHFFTVNQQILLYQEIQI